MVSNLTIELRNGTMLEGPRHIPIWLPFVSVVPAFLLFLLLFIETEICEYVELLLFSTFKLIKNQILFDIRMCITL